MVLPHIGLEGIVRVFLALPVTALQQVCLVFEDQAGVGELLLEIEVHVLAGLLVHGDPAVELHALQVLEDGGREEVPRADTAQLIQQVLRESIIGQLLELGCHHFGEPALG